MLGREREKTKPEQPAAETEAPLPLDCVRPPGIEPAEWAKMDRGQQIAAARAGKGQRPVAAITVRDFDQMAHTLATALSRPRRLGE